MNSKMAVCDELKNEGTFLHFRNMFEIRAEAPK